MAAKARIIITRVANPGEVLAQIEPKMRALGNAVAVRMQRLVPKRTWALHDTIATDTVTDGSKVITSIGAGGGIVDYALHVERGTSRAPAQPYMRPALLQTKAADITFGGEPRQHGIRSTSRPARRSR